MNIALVTDAWHPQINGVVRTWSVVIDELERAGHRVNLITPADHLTLACPGEPDIRLSLVRAATIQARLTALAPEAVHIATEGPLGLAARTACRRLGVAFTTSYHTHFPRYLKLRFGLPERLSRAAVARFHRPATRVMVTTPTLAATLAEQGIAHTALWARGVDTRGFAPREDAIDLAGHARPVMIYVGRVAVEKNVAAFLALDVPGTKVVVGDGPDRARLARAYPQAVFAGWQTGEALARWYAAADVFVFPSRTDTYGLVLLEALASGLPVAAYPVPGPRDVLGDAPHVACLDNDLARAVRGALALSPTAARAHARSFSWAACAHRFVELLACLPADAWAGPSPRRRHGLRTRGLGPS